MRPSSLPAYRLSDLRPQHINLVEGEHRSILCPECGTWRMIRRGMVWPHYDDEHMGVRCPGSARRLVLDITVEEWGLRLLTGEGEAAARRRGRQFHKPSTPVAEPLHRMAAGTPRAPRKSPARRAAEWRAVAPAVERADRLRAETPTGQAPAEAPSVPTEPLRIAS